MRPTTTRRRSGRSKFQRRVAGGLALGIALLSAGVLYSAVAPQPQVAQAQDDSQLVAQGQTNRQMAIHLGLSPKTVDTHRSSMMRKLGLHDAQAVTRFALRRGLISPE